MQRDHRIIPAAAPLEYAIPSRRGTSRKISTAAGASVSLSSRWFFVRVPGIVMTPVSRLISDHNKPPISSRRQPVSNSNLTIRPKSSGKHAFQTVLISSSLRILSRAGIPFAGFSVLAAGLALG